MFIQGRYLIIYLIMPSAQAKKRAERKKQQEKERMAKQTGKKEEENSEQPAVEEQKAVDDVAVDLAKLNARGTSGVLSSHPLSADVHIHNFSMTFHGKVKNHAPEI